MSIIDTYVHSDNTEYEIADSATRTRVSAVEGKIPSGASSSNKMATASDITTVTNGVIANTKLIKDTVGWNGKNKLNYKVINDYSSTLTLTDLGTGYKVVTNQAATYLAINYQLYNSLKANKDYKFSTDLKYGSGGAKIIISGSHDGTNRTVLNQTSAYTSNAHIECEFNTGTFEYIRISLFVTLDTASVCDVEYTNIMLRDADILDDTYEPYHESVATTMFPRSEQAVLGAKNLLKNLEYSASGNYEVDGITYAFDASTGIVTANGTASADSQFMYALRTKMNFVLKKGTYILSGCPSGGASNSYRLQGAKNKVYNNPSAGYDALPLDTGSGTTWDLSEDAQIQLSVFIPSGTTVSNLVFKPMIRLASDPDSTYAPYAMTNRELTDKVGNGYRPNVIYSDNLDDAPVGTVYASNTASNNPASTYGLCETFLVSPSTAIQRFISPACDLYIRFKSNTWGSWKKFTGTAI